MTPNEFINLDLKTIKELLNKYYKPGIDIKKLAKKVVPRSFYCKRWPTVYKGMMIDSSNSIICLRYFNVLIEVKIDEKKGVIALEKYRNGGGDWYSLIDSY